MTDAHATPHWPVEVRLNKADRQLSVTFDDGAAFAYPAEYLRVESPSAEVMGHGPGQRVIVAGRADVGISTIEPVGNYAIRIVFDDGHDTGIYSWRYLYDIGENRDRIWSEYLAALEARDLKRES
jgi:DUF971 family protein